MKFNTAILYDIENLIGGYGKSEYLSNLSLKDIYDEILRKDIDEIAIQRAYANWSDTRLNILKGDIVELGIEPIQMFGLGRGPQKNVSDIQLAIDAIEIAFTKQAIEKFVIVSGDGGFSALAKKLHEYGKMVIGCAYRKATNRVFRAVCDDFIWIDEPKDEYGATQVIGEFTHPILKSYSRKYAPMQNVDHDQIVSEAQQILKFLAGNKDAKRLLKNAGLNISVFSQAMGYRIDGFNHIALGFTKFVDFIRYISNNSECKLIYRAPSEYRLLMEDSYVSGFEDVEPITEIREIHTLENYIQFLSKGTPAFRLPSKDVLFNIAQHLSDYKVEYQGVLIRDIIDNLSVTCDYEQNDIKGGVLSFGVLSFVSGGCFKREPEDANLSEQKLSFIPQSPEQALSMLKEAVYSKLEKLLGNVKDDIFSEIIS